LRPPFDAVLNGRADDVCLNPSCAIVCTATYKIDRVGFALLRG